MFEDEDAERSESARERRRKRRARPGSTDYFHKYWRDWLTDAGVRALSREERAGWADVECQTWATATPGLYTEDQCRAWAGYAEKEWPAHRERFLALHKVRPNGVWIRPAIRSEALATQTRLRRSKKAAQVAAQKRWRDKEKDALRIPQRMPQGMPSQPVIHSLVSETNAKPSADVCTRGNPPSSTVLTGELLARMAAVAGVARGET